MPNVLITPATLNGLDAPHMKILRDAGFTVSYPPSKPLLSEDELLKYLGGSVATIAGSEPYTNRVLAAHPGFRVVARCGSDEKAWEVDRIIANVGYEPDRRLYSELQISEHVETFAPTSLKQPEPNFFVLGAKSQGRSPHFLLTKGFEQVREAFALLAGQPGLDLYKKPRT